MANACTPADNGSCSSLVFNFLMASMGLYCRKIYSLHTTGKSCKELIISLEKS